MKFSIELAYNALDSVRTLFTEYTRMLGVNLDFQNYEQELLQLPGKYALPDGRLYLARCEGEAIGCVALRRLGPTSCEMKRLYVKPEFRGQKVGQILAEKVIADAEKLKYEYMVLDTLAQLDKAIKLYQKLGFYNIEPYYENPLDNVIYMRRDLGGIV